MTTWENTDSINESENLTVTSDAAFERVTNDFKMEEETAWWYLKQNTAWLVQEIPNISFLDIADTMLENKKTLHNRNNWNVVVWKKGKSIEVIPQWYWEIYLSSAITVSWSKDFVPLTWSAQATDEEDCLEIVMNNSWESYAKVKREWYYVMKYNGSIHNTTVTNNASNKLKHWFSVRREAFQTITVLNELTVSMWYTYYASISNELVSYCMVWDKIWVHINRSSGSVDIEQMSFYVKYLFDIKN